LIVLGLLGVFWGKNRGPSLEGLFRTPLLVFSLVFVLVFGVGIGLAAMNLGSLSRYRAPLMPFYVTLLLVLRERVRRANLVPPRARAYAGLRAPRTA
jgi:hypothetical protein